MHKCPNCGKEFEGSFCPNCGEKRQEEKTCPECGAKLSGEAKFCNECGYAFYKAAHRPKRELSAKQKSIIEKVIRIAVALVVVVAIVFAGIKVVSCLRDPLRLKKVEEIRIGMDADTVTRELGKPDNEKEYYFEWYENKVTKKLKKIDELEKKLDSIESFDDLEDIMNESIKLESQLAEMDYKYLRVTFDSDKKVVEVYFNTKFNYGSKLVMENKTGVQGKIIYENLSLHAIETNGEWLITGNLNSYGNKDIAYAEYYSDKSYYASARLFTPDMLEIQGETVIAKWKNLNNEFRTTCKCEIVKPASFLDADGTLYINENISSGQYKDNTEIKSLIIFDGVKSIGRDAFSGCTNLEQITVPDSVTSIGAGAFTDTAYYTNTDNWENDAIYIGKHLIKANTAISGDYQIKAGTLYISAYAFEDCTSLVSVTIPDSVTSIGHDAFYCCSGLTSVIIPDSMTSIGNSAFSHCGGLTSVTIPGNVTSIGDYVFYCCSSLTSVTIPDSVTTINKEAFSGCYILESINFGGTKEQWKAIEKGGYWYNIGDFNVHCTDGDLSKNEAW